MRRYGVVIVALLVISAFALSAAGQAQSTSSAARRPTRMTNPIGQMSAEERTKLRERWQNMSEQEREQFRAGMRERLGSARPGEGATSPAVLKEQIEKMKAEHEALLDELSEIRALAAKEKAQKTADRIEALISKTRRQFTAKLQEMQRRIRGTERVRPDRPGRREQPTDAGKRAAGFTLQSFDGRTVNLADYKGRIVVLEWLNFECPFSRYHYATKHTMVELAEKYKEKNVVWLAINGTSHATPEANKAFAATYKLPFPILDDRSGSLGRAYGAKTTPHIFIIGPAGNIVYEGAIDNSPMGQKKEGVINYVDKALAELIAGKDISTSKTEPYGCTVKYAQ